MTLAVALAAVLLAANAFFVAVEFALVGARRSRLESRAAAGDRASSLALGQMSELNLQLAGAQLGITMASLLLGHVAEPAIVAGIEGLLGNVELGAGARRAVAVVAGLSLVVFLHLVIGEMVPKNLAISDPERTARLLARLNRLYFALFRPVIRLLTAAATRGVRLLGVQPRDVIEEVHTAEELAVLVDEAHDEGLIEDQAHGLLRGVLDFGGRRASEVMVPRGRIVGLARQTPLGEAEAVVRDRGHSRLPVFGRGLDDPLGFVHAKDLLAAGRSDRGQPLSVRLIRRLPVVRPDRPCEDLLRLMRRSGVHLALVVSDQGRTEGLVALEDLLEELVGDIVDESDRDDPRPAG